MKVALVAGVNAQDARASGTRSHVLGLADALTRLHHQVTVIGTGSNGEGHAWEFVSVTTHPQVSSIRFLAALLRNVRLLPVEDTIVHAHRPDDLVPFSLRSDCRSRILTLHGLSTDGIRERHGPLASSFYRRLERTGLALANRIVVLDSRTRSDVEARYPGLRGKLVSGSGGVDVVQFSPRPREEARRSLGVKDVPTIAYVGRLAPEKNLPLLLKAVASLGAVQFLVAGDGPLRRLLDDWAQHREDVLVMGSVDSSRVSALMNAADVVALPSAREAFPAVYLEALACGTPVVATRVGGLVDVIREGVNGFFTAPEPAALGSALQRAIERSASMREACRETVLRFGWDSVAEAIVRVYEGAPG